MIYSTSTRRIWRWDVKVAKKPNHTTFFPDKNTKLVHESATIVSKRIDDYLRISSVQATFDIGNVEAICRTANGLHYKISLYIGPGDTHNDSNSTYIEIVRIKGCGFQFTNERKRVINAATRPTTTMNQQPPPKMLPKIMKLPTELLISYEPPSLSDLQDILYRATDQLHSQKQQGILFTLQSLVSMTTRDEDFPQTADQMSMLIMENFVNIRDMILIICVNNAVESSCDNIINDTSDRICSACLHILINSMASLMVNNDGLLLNHQGDDNDSEYLFNQFVPSLWETAKNYKNSTHKAHLALTCLEMLIKCIPAAYGELRNMEIGIVLEEARLYGQREHLKLEMAASRMLETFREGQGIAVSVK